MPSAYAVWHWRRISWTVLALTSLLLVTSCATKQELPPPTPAPAPVVAPPPRPAPHAAAKPSKAVKASFQGRESAGRPTASGEPYNPEDLTAASRTLPIGSSIVVTNPATGRSVKVRINDRGPYVHGRSLDLSRRAAEKIGLTEKGVGRVKVKRADPDSDSDESSVYNADSSPAATSISDR